jgi:ABC-type uncharacterized transport system substrate-binding protein
MMEETQMAKKYVCFSLLSLAFVIFGFIVDKCFAAGFNVLVVFSYEEDLDWHKEMRKAIDSVLGNSCNIKWFYMDTKNNLAAGPQKAKKAYALYQTFRPDGIIAADDNAQSMFVVPFLKDKVKTPVMFCGVNAEPEEYGYPASNVSGILERMHINESLALVKQLVPSIKTFGGMEKDSPTGRAYLKTFQDESEDFIVKFMNFKLPKTIAEAVETAKTLRETSDLLFMATMKGIADENGKPLTEKEAINMVCRAFGKPTFTNVEHGVKYGILCAVVQRGWEQGETAAKMLLEAMNGTPVSQIPVTRNRYGKRIINVTVMKELGINPKPVVLRGVELVRTEE